MAYEICHSSSRFKDINRSWNALVMYCADRWFREPNAYMLLELYEEVLDTRFQPQTKCGTLLQFLFPLVCSLIVHHENMPI